MLLSMRNGFMSKLFLGLLVFGGAGLVLSDWNGMFRGGGIGPATVATVDGEKISAVEFDRNLSRVLRQQKITPQDAYKMGLIERMLNAEVMQSLTLKSAEHAGLEVDDRHIAERVHDMLTPLLAGKTDPKDKKEALNRILMAQGMTERDLVNAIRQDLTTTLFRQSLMANTYVPDALVQDMLAFRMEERDIRVVNLPLSRMSDVKPATDEELNDYYEVVKTQYSEPEQRSFTVAILDPKAMGIDATVTDADVQAFYDDNSDAYAIEETRSLEQAILTKEEDAKAVFEKAASGSLKDAVKTVTGDVKAYTAENSFGKDGLLETIATPVFSAKKGDVVGPIKTPLGWHVIRVSDIKEPHTKPLSEVQAEIRKELQQSKSSDQVFEVADQIEDRIAGGESLDVLAKEFKLTLMPVKNATQATLPEQLKSFAEADRANVAQMAFTTAEGEASTVSDLSDGRLYTVRADEVKPQRIKALDEIKSELMARWQKEKQGQANLIDAQQKLDALQKGGMSLEQIGAVQTFKSVKRSSDSVEGLSANALTRAGDLGKGESALVMTESGAQIIQVSDVRQSKQKPDAKAADEVRQTVRTEMREEIMLQYLDNARVKFRARTNPELLQKLYQKAPESDS